MGFHNKDCVTVLIQNGHMEGAVSISAEVKLVSKRQMRTHVFQYQKDSWQEARCQGPRAPYHYVTVPQWMTHSMKAPWSLSLWQLASLSTVLLWQIWDPFKASATCLLSELFAACLHPSFTARPVHIADQQRSATAIAPLADFYADRSVLSTTWKKPPKNVYEGNSLLFFSCPSIKFSFGQIFRDSPDYFWDFYALYFNTISLKYSICPHALQAF